MTITDIFMSWFKKSLNYYTRENGKANLVDLPLFFCDNCGIHNKVAFADQTWITLVFKI